MTDSRLFVATRKGLFVLDRATTGWRVSGHHFPGEPVSQCLADPRDGAWYTALRMGHFGVKMRRSPDGGRTWTEIASPSFPARPTDGPWADDPTPWNVDMVWSLAAAGGPGASGELWAGCAPAGLFRSCDGGNSWSLIESLWLDPRRREWMGGGYDHAGIHSICVDPRDPKQVSIAISCGGVWQSADDGASWTLVGEGLRAPYMPEDGALNPNIQDVHALSQCSADPRVFWIQHHDGCYRSTDGARSFTRLTEPAPGDFGFPIACDPGDANRAWVVPAAADSQRYATDGAMHVARTDDGGRSWRILRSGLPQTHAYDLVYRHGLALAPDRRTLAIGSTSGGVWISADAGEHWASIDARLPPVLQVRFIDG